MGDIDQPQAEDGVLATAPLLIDKNEAIRSALDILGQLSPTHLLINNLQLNLFDMDHALTPHALKAMLLEQDAAGNTLLMVLLKERKGFAVEAVFQLMDKLLGPTAQAAILKIKNNTGATALQLAFDTKQHVDALVSRIKTLPVEEQRALVSATHYPFHDHASRQPTDLYAWLLYIKSLDNENGDLFQACISRKEQVSWLLDRSISIESKNSLIKDWPDTIAIPLLRDVLKQASSSYWVPELIGLVRQYSFEQKKSIFSGDGGVRMKDVDRLKSSFRREYYLLQLADQGGTKALDAALQTIIQQTDALPENAPIDDLYALKYQWEGLLESIENNDIKASLAALNPAHEKIYARLKAVQSSKNAEEMTAFKYVKYVKLDDLACGLIRRIAKETIDTDEKSFQLYLDYLAVLPTVVQANILQVPFNRRLLMKADGRYNYYGKWTLLSLLSYGQGGPNNAKIEALLKRIDTFDVQDRAFILDEKNGASKENLLVWALRMKHQTLIDQLRERVNQLDEADQKRIENNISLPFSFSDLPPLFKKIYDVGNALREHPAGGDIYDLNGRIGQLLQWCSNRSNISPTEYRAFCLYWRSMIRDDLTRVSYIYDLTRVSDINDCPRMLKRIDALFVQALAENPLPMLTDAADIAPVVASDQMAHRLADKDFWLKNGSPDTIQRRLDILSNRSVSERESILPQVANTIVDIWDAQRWPDFFKDRAMDANALLTGWMLLRCVGDHDAKGLLEDILCPLSTSETLLTEALKTPEGRLAMIQLLLLLPVPETAVILARSLAQISACSVEIIACLKSDSPTGIEMQTALDLLLLLPFTDMRAVLKTNPSLHQKIVQYLNPTGYITLLTKAEKTPETGTVPLFKALFLQDPVVFRKQLMSESGIGVRMADLFTYDVWFPAAVDPMVRMANTDIRAMANWYLFFKYADPSKRAKDFERLHPEGAASLETLVNTTLTSPPISPEDMQDLCVLLFALPITLRQHLLSVPGRLQQIANAMPLNVEGWAEVLTQAEASLEGLEVAMSLLNALDGPNREELWSSGMQDRIKQCMVNQGSRVGREDAARYYDLLFKLTEREHLVVLRSVGQNLFQVAPTLPFLTEWMAVVAHHQAMEKAVQAIKNHSVSNHLKHHAFFKDIQAGVFDPPNGPSIEQVRALLTDDDLLFKIFSSPDQALQAAIIQMMTLLGQQTQALLLTSSPSSGVAPFVVAAQHMSIDNLTALTTIIGNLPQGRDIFMTSSGAALVALVAGRRAVDRAEQTHLIFTLFKSFRDPQLSLDIVQACMEHMRQYRKDWCEHVDNIGPLIGLIQTLDVTQQAKIFDELTRMHSFESLSKNADGDSWLQLNIIALANQLMKLKAKYEASQSVNDEKNYLEALHLYTTLSQSIYPWTERPTKATATFDYDVPIALSRAEGHFTRSSTMKTIVKRLSSMNIPALLSADKTQPIEPVNSEPSAPPQEDIYQISKEDEELLLALDDEETLTPQPSGWFAKSPVRVAPMPEAKPKVQALTDEKMWIKNLSEPQSSWFKTAVSQPNGQELEKLLQFIQNKSPAIQARILRASSPKQMNKLMMVALMQPTLLPFLVRLVDSATRADRGLKQTLLTHSYKSDNGLTVALLNREGQPQSVACLLTAIKTLPLSEQAVIFKPVRGSAKILKTIAEILKTHPSLQRDFYLMELTAKAADFEAQSRGWWLSKAQKQRYIGAANAIAALHTALLNCDDPVEWARQAATFGAQLQKINMDLKKNSNYFLSSYLDLNSMTGKPLMPALTACAQLMEPLTSYLPSAPPAPVERRKLSSYGLGDNPLMEAIKNGQQISGLLYDTSLLTEVNHAGQTALRIAMEVKHSELPALLYAVLALDANGRREVLKEETSLLGSQSDDPGAYEALLLLELERIYLRHSQDTALRTLFQTLRDETLSFQQKRAPDTAAKMLHAHAWSSAIKTAEKALTHNSSKGQNRYGWLFGPSRAKNEPDFSALGADKGAAMALFQQLHLCVKPSDGPRQGGLRLQ